jgi:hypothetical protein
MEEVDLVLSFSKITFPHLDGTADAFGAGILQLLDFTANPYLKQIIQTKSR